MTTLLLRRVSAGKAWKAYCSLQFCTITGSSHGRHGVSNHRWLNCLFIVCSCSNKEIITIPWRVGGGVLALELSVLYKTHIFQRVGKIFCVNFRKVSLKFRTKYLTHTLKDVGLIHMQKNWYILYTHFPQRKCVLSLKSIVNWFTVAFSNDESIWFGGYLWLTGSKPTLKPFTIKPLS